MSDRVKKTVSILTPLLIAASLAVGVYLGSWIEGKQPDSREIFLSRGEKGLGSVQSADLNRILQVIEKKYVDSVNTKELTQKVLQHLLKELDPHSYFIPEKKKKSFTEPLEGNFDGIGVQFMIQKDTVVVVTPISGGPSESLGIQPGDRIIKVEGKNIAGIGIENKDVVDQLRGERGTKVNITVYRPSQKDTIPFEITRGKIPIHSVDVGFMVDKETGYVKISRFSRNTHKEFLDKTDKLLNKGMEKLVLDLRGNGGGYLDAAIKIADEFLQDGKLIVYTEGRNHPKRSYSATSRGNLEDTKVAVLVNRGSASASEIVAGALQDHGRGLIVGRRSFGKGLVQQQMDFSDLGAIRLTVARYHTPTGRCIQKPYGDGIDYDEELFNRYSEGELIHIDSIDLPDSLKYKTRDGDVVYGGGGIMPDIFVPLDTANVTDYYTKVTYGGLLNQFAFDHADKKREEIGSEYQGPDEFKRAYKVSPGLLKELKEYAGEKGVEYDPAGFEKARDLIALRLKALIARNIWNDRGYYPIILEDDKIFQKAVKALEKEKGAL